MKDIKPLIRIMSQLVLSVILVLIGNAIKLSFPFMGLFFAALFIYVMCAVAEYAISESELNKKQSENN